MTKLDSLSEQQATIYNYLGQGLAPAQIAKKMDTTEALVRANMTRIVNKGVSLPVAGGVDTEPANPSHLPTEQIITPPTRPASTGGSENERIAEELRKGGQAVSAEELAAIAAKVGGRVARDIHPMILMGITIQFVKTCGNRFVAHQVIEDVYAALKSFVGDTTPDKGGEATPFQLNDRSRLEFLEQQNKTQAERIEKLERELRGHQDASH